MASHNPRRPDEPHWLPRDDPTPVSRALTTRRIVVAALELVETHGLDALTMRRVASAVQVTPMSLYNHVSDKAELVDLMCDLIIGQLIEAAAHDTGSWEARLRSLVHRNYDLWRDHPGLVKVYTEGVTLGPNGLASVELTVGVLKEAGFDDADAAAAFMMLYRWIVASLLVLPAAPLGRTALDSAAWRSTADRINRDFTTVPAEADLMGHDVDFGLDVIIAGFKARLGRPDLQ